MTASRLATLLLVLSMHNISAGQILKGKVYEEVSDSTLGGINVFNLRSKLPARSGPDGSYSIDAGEGDRVVFSAAGFRPDTVTVTHSMLLTQHDVSLKIFIVSLRSVTVTGSYQSDSLARREFYRKIYNQPGITGGNRPTDGVGVSISPISFLSRGAKQKRQLKKRLIRDEREAYIDHSFPTQWVENLTNLHGDSLRLFMYRYRPSYAFCRKTNREQMVLYINDKLKEFKQVKRD